MTFTEIILSIIAPSFFLIGWQVHTWLVEKSQWRKMTLSAAMEKERRAWIYNMTMRDMRMIDTNVISSLQSATAFFASTSLLAIGAAFTLLNSSETFISISSKFSFIAEMDHNLFQIKAIGLSFIFAYAFLKFGWAYRLFNYTAILVGSVPMVLLLDQENKDPQGVQFTEEKIAQHTEITKAQELKAANMSVNASREFNRGQRVFFLAIAYLAWFIGDLPFIAATIIVLAMMIIRQFNSPAKTALTSVIDD